MHSVRVCEGLRTLRVEKMISLMVSEGSVSAPACTHMWPLQHSVCLSGRCLSLLRLLAAGIELQARR